MTTDEEITRTIAEKVKLCSVCSQEKPESEFWRKARNADGLTCACKDCRRAFYHQKPYKPHPDRWLWQGMRQRCHNPNHEAYYNYGGRGIKCCARWATFDAFLADMGPRPSPDHTLERVDIDGNYEPENCCWALRVEQARNTRRTKLSPIAVAAIKRQHDRGISFRVLAARYHCHPKTISNAYYGRSWT